MADQLTYSEAKMLRELAGNHFPLGRNPNFDGRLQAVLSELLLAAKEKAARRMCSKCAERVPLKNGRHVWNGVKLPCDGDVIRNSDWGKLFEVK